MKNDGKAVIEDILMLERLLRTQNRKAKELEDLVGNISDLSAANKKWVAASGEWKAASKRAQTTANKLSELKKSLGLAESQRLSRMRSDKFLRQQIGARKLKDRIVAKMRERKFELERVERSYRSTQKGEHLLPVLAAPCL